MTRSAGIVWATHPRHLPPPPGGRVVVVDVAFAAGSQFKKKTLPFIEALGDRLVMWLDHHEHKAGWKRFADDPRFVLVPNKIAHACPELVTPERVQQAEAEAGRVAAVVAHGDFDGLVAGVKWRLGGVPPWPEADEDARAVDSPGRGHTLSETGRRLADALEEASAIYDKDTRLAFMDEIAAALVHGEEPLALEQQIDDLARVARDAAAEARELAAASGGEEVPGVYVVRVDHALDNRTRKHLLVYAEEQAPIGALYEPDKEGGAWVTAATFDERLDLERVAGFEGGRSDYRFSRASADGAENIRALGAYLATTDV
jgi:hypothetical protein